MFLVDDDAVDWTAISRQEMYGRAIARVRQQLVHFRDNRPAGWAEDVIPCLPNQGDNRRCGLEWQLHLAWEVISFLNYHRNEGRALESPATSWPEGYSTLLNSMRLFCEETCDGEALAAMVVRHAA